MFYIKVIFAALLVIVEGNSFTMLKPLNYVMQQAAVTDIQVIASGFLTCGGDGLVKLVQLQ